MLRLCNSISAQSSLAGWARKVNVGLMWERLFDSGHVVYHLSENGAVTGVSAKKLCKFYVITHRIAKVGLDCAKVLHDLVNFFARCGAI